MVAIGGVTRIAYGYSVPLGTVAPSSSSSHSYCSLGRSLRILLPAVRIATKPVLAPFAHIAGHVVKPQLVGPLLSDGVGAGAVRRCPAHLLCVVAASIDISLAGFASPGGKLPFSLSGQSESFVCDPVQLTDKLLALFVTY